MGIFQVQYNFRSIDSVMFIIPSLNIYTSHYRDFKVWISVVQFTFL